MPKATRPAPSPSKTTPPNNILFDACNPAYGQTTPRCSSAYAPAANTGWWLNAPGAKLLNINPPDRINLPGTLDAGTVLSLLGPEGLTRTAELSMQRAREAAAALIALPGVKLLNNAPYGQEFAVVLPKPAAQVVKALADKKILAGIPLGLWYKGMDNVLLTACTEKTTPANIAALAAALRGAL